MNVFSTSNPETICTICGSLIHYHGTKKCDRCWELARRIRDDVRLARKILRMVEKEKRQENVRDAREYHS